MVKRSQGAAIRMSKRRRTGENIPPPPKGKYPEATRRRAERDFAVGHAKKRKSRAAGKTSRAAASSTGRSGKTSRTGRGKRRKTSRSR